MAEELDYVPLPVAVVDVVAQAWKSKLVDGAGKPVWPASH
jgi:hypothetical protein